MTWYFGLPLVPAALVAGPASRNNRVLPALFILGYLPTARETDVFFGGAAGVSTLWPPSAAMTFAVLPYLQTAYAKALRYVFEERERRWLATIRPRGTEGAAEELGDGRRQDDVHLHHHHHRVHEDDPDGADEFAVEFDIGVEILDEGEPAPAPDVPRARDPERPADQPADQPAEQAPVQPAPAPAPAPRREGGGGGGGGADGARWLLDTVRIADAVVGALAFPAVAAAAGFALKLVLPRAWTAERLTRGGVRPGLLQSQWGRSVVGGCLFVAVKDAVMLYARYRLARDHGRRRVLDWKGKRTGEKGMAGG